MAKIDVSNRKNDDLTIERFYTEEIVVGLCGPIGVDLKQLSDTLQDILQQYRYDFEEIKLSKLIEDLSGKVEGESRLNRIKLLIEKGNKLREENNNASYVAEFAINQILKTRTKDFPDKKYGTRRKCIVINSIKNLAEYKVFRQIYGESFYLIGVFSSEEQRISNLIKGDISLKNQAVELIGVDYNQKGIYGQQVSKVFQSADYFLRLESADDLKVKINRFIELVLGSELRTPSYGESAMFAAASAARNSACMSRQVGAAIVKPNGLLISTGWNDVPKFRGGTYDSMTGNDHRCYKDGEYCRNDRHKEILINEIVDSMIEEEIIESSNKNNTLKLIAKSKVGDLIEFSRAVHAEMHAILNAARAGSGQLGDAVLYCTTFPCHSCARHIVASGIERVYFIEPYPKSKALLLHSDSITEVSGGSGKLEILAYEGVSPYRYLDFFEIKRSRKDSKGDYSKVIKIEARPQVDKIFESTHVLEAVVANQFNNPPVDGGEIVGGVENEKEKPPKAA